KPYQTTIVALPTGDGYLIPLPFGDDTQWVKNVMAAPQAGLRHAGRDLVIDRPEVVELDRIRAELPAPIRFMSGLLGLHDFVRVRKATG
ncbi:MAG: nitroreductase family deazaflavin-dependent oxidoreductase, partial [Candidatus Limnocylindria bacterium]